MHHSNSGWRVYKRADPGASVQCALARLTVPDQGHRVFAWEAFFLSFPLAWVVHVDGDKDKRVPVLWSPTGSYRYCIRQDSPTDQRQTGNPENGS